MGRESFVRESPGAMQVHEKESRTQSPHNPSPTFLEVRAKQEESPGNILMTFPSKSMLVHLYFFLIQTQM